MGQKANVLTLRTANPNISLTTFNTNLFKNYLNFIHFFQRALYLKGIWVANQTVNSSGNTTELNLSLYYRSFKILIYKRRKLKKLLIKALVFKKKKFKIHLLFSKYFSFFKSKLFLLNIKNINKQLNKKILIFFFKKLKPFIKNFFSRRFNLFIDFLKITTLLYQNKINISTYLLLLANTFKNLSKRSHGRFFSFLSVLFKLLLSPIFKKMGAKSHIKGLKFSISGRLSGKARSSYNYIKEGQVPIQSLSKNIEFAKMHVYNLLGAFGIRIWLYKN
jgi:hypothetical protein